MRNPTIFDMSNAFKGNPLPTCEVTMNTATSLIAGQRIHFGALESGPRDRRGTACSAARTRYSAFRLAVAALTYSLL